MSALYDTIGLNYASGRRTDPRIAKEIHAHLGRAKTVLNVGAGSGSYEPTHLKITAVEPSLELIRQRPASDVIVVQAHAEDLPFQGNTFDVALAILIVHHWSNAQKGLSEMRRVTRGKIIIFTFDPLATDFWLSDYLPELGTLDQKQMLSIADFETVLGPVDRINVPIPHDCIDGLLCAYWCRPAAYLEPDVRRSMSSFSKISNVTEGLQRLEDDIQTGEWARKYSRFLDQDSYDFGYHLVVTRDANQCR
ncbi:MAG: class I SAM-dependent methyltransferase [Alphaproteobacteria bacterium]|nr:class I SAM-dependent methyltransferase [Alphaproteobacteria bacterium]